MLNLQLEQGAIVIDGDLQNAIRILESIINDQDVVLVDMNYNVNDIKIHIENLSLNDIFSVLKTTDDLLEKKIFHLINE